MKNTKLLFLTLSGAALLLTGCSQRTINSANSDANHDVSAVSHAAKVAAREAKPQLQKLALGTRVSAALVNANIHGVRVDSSPNGVTLVGHVKHASTEQRAMQIARDTLGPNKTVSSRLTIGP